MWTETVCPGHNGHVAWSFTQLFGDITDWYVEELSLVTQTEVDAGLATDSELGLEPSLIDFVFPGATTLDLTFEPSLPPVLLPQEAGANLDLRLVSLALVANGEVDGVETELVRGFVHVVGEVTADIGTDGPLAANFRFITKPDPNGPTAKSAIEALGFKCDDVRFVVPTHLDLDHAGGLAEFPKAAVHVFQREHDEAMTPSKGHELRYVQAHWGHGPDWKLHEPDGESWQGFESVRPIRDDIKARIEDLIASLTPAR